MQYGRQAMGDNDRGAILHQFLQGQLHLVFALGVQGAGRLIQQQDFRIVENGPGQRDALALAAGQPDPLLPQMTGVAIR